MTTTLDTENSEKGGLISSLKGQIPLTNQNIRGLNLYFDAETPCSRTTRNNRWYCFHVGIDPFELGNVIVLTQLGYGPRRTGEVSEKFWETKYKPAVNELISKIKTAIESGKYKIRLSHGGLIDFLFIKNQDGIEEKII